MKFRWTRNVQYYFKEIKRIVARKNLSTYPDCNEEFKINTDDRKFQSGAVIIHNGKPIALYIRKLTDSQKRYTVTENDMLSIAKNLK